MTQAAPGWYSDPAGSSALRWWNGVQWTADLRHVERTDLEASMAARPAAVGTLPVSGRESGYQENARQPNHYEPHEYQPNGAWENGYQPNGDQPSGDQPNGYQPNGYQPAPYAPSPSAFSTQYPTHAAGQAMQVGFGKRNKYALFTLAALIVYLAIGIVGHLVFIGLLPLLLASRSFRAKEKLAPLAAGAAAIAVLFSLLVLFG
ncbi:MAG: hypothetical protein JWN95_2045 [Frankiales bacterium]|nr:hypothetical protein [Frankiales bacterium]